MTSQVTDTVNELEGFSMNEVSSEKAAAINNRLREMGITLGDNQSLVLIRANESDEDDYLTWAIVPKVSLETDEQRKEFMRLMVADLERLARGLPQTAKS
jgi:hypothetical protein